MTRLERWTLSNGMTVLYRQDAAFPLVSATFLFRVGSRQELPKEAGLCSMTVDLLMQGTRRRTARQLASAMETVGASIGTQVHEDYAEMGFIAPASEMDRALKVAGEVLSEPAFPKEEITKEKAHVQASLASRHDAIFNLAFDQLNSCLYGDHPYGRPLEGRKETVAAFSRSDFQAWHREKLHPEEGILSIISPFSKKDVVRRLEKTIDEWHARVGPKSLPAPIVRPLATSHSRALHSSFEQAYFMVGWQAPGTLHRDQIPLKVLNTLLGGGMSSRLFVTLREKLGLAYEVSSFYPSRLGTSQWVIYLGLPAEKLTLAAKKLNELLDQLADKGPNARELQQAKAMIRGAFLMDRQSRRRQAWYHAWWEYLGRGSDYGEEFLKQVDAVTPAQLHTLVQNFLKQPRVTVTVVPK